MSQILIVLDTEIASKKSIIAKPVVNNCRIVNTPFYISSHSIEIYDQ